MLHIVDKRHSAQSLMMYRTAVLWRIAPISGVMRTTRAAHIMKGSEYGYQYLNLRNLLVHNTNPRRTI